MTDAYNFIAGWQLFPEKCVYQEGLVPRSGTFKIAAAGDRLVFTNNWVTVEGSAFTTQFSVVPNGQPHPFEDTALAAFCTAHFKNSGWLQLQFTNNSGSTVLEVDHEILHNGWLKITQRIYGSNGVVTNTDIYHKQLSILPYAASSSSVAIRPTEEGAIKHKALSAMEEQTNMQLQQIRQQIELLAK